jgi:hypothetical protein
MSSKEAIRQGLIKSGISVREKSKPHERTAQLKIPTKCKEKSWHPEMVKRLLQS